MSPMQRVFAFVLAVFSVYALALYALIRKGIRRSQFSRFEKVLFAIAILGIVCISYGMLIEPYWPEVVHVRVTSNKISKASGQGVRLVHISDVHSDPEVRLEGRLPEMIRAEKPDAILFTGDSINSPEGLPNFQKLFSKLAEIAPLFAVNGNWDTWYWSALKPLEIPKVIQLNCMGQELKVREHSIWISGVSVGDEECSERIIMQAPPKIFSIFLYHYPDLILEIAKTKKIDLYLAGHTHGGQVRLPFYGALITFSAFDKKYEAGLYREGATNLYVNRGIGMEGGRAPRFRFMARPEITVIDVVAE